MIALSQAQRGDRTIPIAPLLASFLQGQPYLPRKTLQKRYKAVPVT
ncbi:MAG TPA: hypothetical protein IGS37_01435 [Synechococcales cyanobacterium M55_K2018_004]|nr:hypothetical protein [Synechococcales cyanobacterium M55_K2018_004]